MVRIGFDGKRAAQNRTGLGNYSRFVVRSLSRHEPASELIVYAPNATKTDALEGLEECRGVSLRFPKGWLSGKLSSAWRSWWVIDDAQKDGVMIFHGLSGELPLNIKCAKEMKSVVTIHDLIFLRYPEYYKFIDRKIYEYKFRKACENADRIIAVSECTKRDVVSFFGVAPERIDVVYQGCDSAFKEAVAPSDKETVRLRYGLPGQYVLYVGSVEPRKNLMLLAKALTRLPGGINVVAVGKRTSYASEVEDFVRSTGLSHRFKILSGVPFADLPSLYQMASVFVYPSRFEGFGIPLVEALVSGVPAIGCKGSCLEEAGGPSSTYVDPDDYIALAEAIERITGSAEVRAKMVADGLEYAKRFEPSAIASDLMRVYDKVLTSGPAASK